MRRFNKNFKSQVDIFLEPFDNTHSTLSFSQQQEIKKYARIYKLRDTVNTEEEPPTPKIWEFF